MENQEFIEAYEKMLDRVGNISKKSNEIREKMNDVFDKIKTGARTIRLVAIDITPSERFVSDNIFFSQIKETRNERQDDGTYKDVEYTVTKHLTTSKGFGELRKTTPYSYKNWDPINTTELNYSKMLEIISDNTKMMELLKEFLTKNKKKASQRVMDLIEIQSEAKELKEFGDGFDNNTISITLDEPVNIKLLSVDYSNSDIIKEEMEIKEIRVENYNGISIIGDEEVKLNEKELKNYPIFIQFIETLENVFNKMTEKLEHDKEMVLEINTRIESKLSEFILLNNLDSSKMEKAGEVRW